MAQPGQSTMVEESNKTGRWRRRAPVQASDTCGEPADSKSDTSHAEVDAASLKSHQAKYSSLQFDRQNTEQNRSPNVTGCRAVGEIGMNNESRWRRPVSDPSGAGGLLHSGSPSITSDCEGQAKPNTLINFNSTVTLRGGVGVPVLGLGTRQLKPGKECRDAIQAALRCGYRLVDTSPTYGNEEDVGNGISAAGLRREDVCIMSHLDPADHGDVESVQEGLQRSLLRLGTTYVDILLIHSPKGGRVPQTWQAMLQMKKLGLAHVVGVSNFSVTHLQGLGQVGCELPEVNQVELHFALQQRVLVSHCARHHIQVIAASPLAGGRLFGAKTLLAEFAVRRNRSEAELALRWCMQRGYVAVPRSKNIKHMETNATFGFSLSTSEMSDMDSLDQGYMSSPNTKCLSLSWEDVAKDVSDFSDDDADAGEGRPRRRRRRRRQKGKGKGKANSVASLNMRMGGGKGGGSSATNWGNMLSALS